ncbi:MAG: extracellular solute-binding protein [Enterocloster asparagiformis]|nr:extracellular solute-binding protein [Enterocloster asparagiformis]
MKPNRKYIRRFFFFILPVFAGCLLLSGRIRREQADYSALAPAEEDRLIIYTSHLEDTYAPIIREFEERTGIWVQVETGGSVELLERIAAESENPRCDVIFGGGVETLDSFSDRFSPYISAESKNLPAEYVQKDGLWTPFSIPPTVLIYNPKLVRTNPPTGWASLLNPAWKGKIAFANPETSGSSYTALATLLQILPGHKEELLRTFFDNLDGRLVPDSSSVVSEVADGSCYIGVTLEENALRSMKKGYDIAMVYPEEGTSAIPDGLAIIAGCRHEENARRFVDFTLGEDVQTYLSRSCNLRAVRKDVPQPGEITGEFLTFPYDIDWAADSQEDILALWHGLAREVSP